MQFASKTDKPPVEIFVADEWSRPEQAVVRYKMAAGFHRSSWDWIGLYRVGAWVLLGLKGVGCTAQHCGVPSELPPNGGHWCMAWASALCFPFPGEALAIIQDLDSSIRSRIWPCFRRFRSSSSLLLLLGGPHSVQSLALLGSWGARALLSGCKAALGFAV